MLLLLLSLMCTVLAKPYAESLDFTPLARNNLLAEFNFQVQSDPKPLQYFDRNNTNSFTPSHYTYFPKSLGPILEGTNTRELHLRFSQGWWDSELWGSLPSNGSHSGGTGVEIWAVIEGENSKQVFESWKKLTVLLSAFFCASFNFIDEAITTFPINAFNSDDLSFKVKESNKLFLLRAALPGEPICTENLTPFLKLLPTRGAAGISSLLDGHKVFDSLWHSMSIDIKTECEQDLCHYKLDQGISVIVDVMRSLRKKEEGAIPKPVPGKQLRCDESSYTIWQCFPLGLPTEVKYDLNDIFGRRIKGAPFKGQSTPIRVNYKASGWDIRILDGLNKVVSLSENDSTYSVTSSDQINIEFSASNTTQVVKPQTAPLGVSRSLTGYAQDAGGFRVVFENNEDKPIKFVYFESLPWFTRLYLNTMKAATKTADGVYEEVSVDKYVTLSHYQPAVDRSRPSHMELTINLPPRQTLTLNYQFDKALLLYAEYPPDANHGFSAEPAVINVLDENNQPVYELRTTSSLVTLPTPDFSMPYNVIILTGTVMSLAFGSIFNLLIKDVITEEEFEKLAANSKLRKAATKLKARVAAVKALVRR